ncbi:MAG: hypothetical protein PWP04_1499 [Candidatus Atribacteria bacterium]|nr:hypothetical protein [Candidatus Atribacteria bacterium]
MAEPSLNLQLKTVIQTLVQEIKDTSSYRNFEHFQSLLLQDPEAVDKIRQWEEKESAVIERIENGEADQEDLMELQNSSQELLSNPLILSYFQAQDKLVSVLQEINREISSELGFDFANSAAQEEFFNDLEEG